MTRHQFPSGRSLAIRCSAGLAFLLVLAAPARAANFSVTNLVSNNTAVNPVGPGGIQDPSLVNPWGVSLSTTSPFWVSDDGTGVSTLYSVNATNTVVSKVALTVTIPGAGSVTGQNFSGTTAFNGDSFVFVSEDGTVSGWRNALGTTAEVLQAGSSANNYQGSTLLQNGANAYLLAANANTGNIDVIKGNAGAPNLTGSFKDPNLPSGATPYNVQLLNGTVYVTYIQAGKVGGIVDSFDTQGNFLGRIATGGVGGSTLNQPWGLAIAPSSFGSIAGDLLVGDKATGNISIINLSNDSLVGLLDGVNGQPITIPDLWALTPGNNGSGGSSQDIYFTAGSQGYTNGIFGVIQSVPEPSTAVLGLIAAGVLSGGWYWKSRRRGVTS